MGFRPERQEVGSVSLLDMKPGERLSIEVGDVIASGSLSVIIEVWPLVSGVSAADAVTGHVAMSVDVLCVQEQRLVMRGVIPMPTALRVGDVFDHLRLGQSSKLEPGWRTALASAGRVERLLVWREQTIELVDMMNLPPGDVVTVRGGSVEVGVFITKTPGAPRVVSSDRPWSVSLAEPDTTCDTVVWMGQKFRWRDGVIAEVIAIAIR